MAIITSRYERPLYATSSQKLAIGLVPVSYVLLASGSISPFFINVTLGIIFPTFILTIFAVLFRSQIFRYILVKSTLHLFPILTALLIATFQTQDLFYAYYKIDGAILATISVAPLMIYSANIIGVQAFVKFFIFTCVIVLVFTIIYKLHFGFWDRSVRFFINGPIIFGWMMSIAALMCLYMNKNSGSFVYVFLFIIFLSSVLWTASKGPLIALIISSSLFFIRINLRVVSSILFIFAFMTITYNIIETIGEGVVENTLSRLSVIGRIIDNNLEDGDFGSVIIRMEMISISMSVFLDNPLFGVGLGNWSFYSGLDSNMLYPHNVVMEILAETGIFGAIIIFSSFLYLWIRAESLGKLLAAMLLMEMSASGDMSYFRIPLSFLLLFAYSQHYRVTRDFVSST
ncbi:O-Antigen ligase [Meinhardsimonia xiamenensis]|uniref:O-Antigen ligase n=1 Tax=Meinhardsimonia xiamenensis TaxID=990712 RepID=A0A1G9HP34_9RHOB|nr:O-antigen ligase family protein [Meinhardsimonia xiamenensis]PRX26968.1 O-antigen ligase-like membrane protein [Meinhardsimonia xiamenensis]SDL14556.1 O-Antigen ligase [Meinhardsimonia xiamenensis]